MSRGNEDASVGRKPGGPEVCTGRAVQGLCGCWETARFG